MELPQLGKHCSETSCKRLDFLPVKCDACTATFCNDHYFYSNHNCPSAYKKDVQVPQCPLCNALVPVPRNQLPDVVVGVHIDNDCQADPAVNRRKAFVNKCHYRKCKTKELVPLVCAECKVNFCFKHRHPSDHKCEGKAAAKRIIAEAAMSRQSNSCARDARIAQQNIQGDMSEDEALARALALSLNEETSDLDLARRLQETENRQTITTASTNSRGRDRCTMA